MFQLKWIEFNILRLTITVKFCRARFNNKEGNRFLFIQMCKKYLKKLHAILKPLSRKYRKELQAADKSLDRKIFSNGSFHPPPAFFFPKTKMLILLSTLRYKVPLIFTLCVIVEWKTFNLFFLPESTNLIYYHFILQKSKAKHLPFKV